MGIVRKIVTDGGRRKYYFLGVKVASLRGPSMLPRTFPAHKEKRTVLVIRRHDMGCGLFAHFGFNLGWTRWAIEHGMVPYVDMQTPPNIINRGVRLAYNPWECFFKQSPEFDAVGAMMSSRIRTTSPYPIPIGPKINPAHLKEGDLELAEWRRIAKEHMRISDGIQEEANRVWESELGGDGNVLGCLVRGTDYVKMKPKWHEIQPEPEQVVEDAWRICEQRGYGRVVLATEDVKVQNLFLKTFGDRLFVYQTCCPDYNAGFLVSSGAVGDGARALEMSRQYMVSVVLLSRCRGLLAGCASGTVGAMILSDGYEWSRIYDLGRYM